MLVFPFNSQKYRFARTYYMIVLLALLANILPIVANIIYAYVIGLHQSSYYIIHF